MKPNHYPYSGQKKKSISKEIDGKRLSKVILEASHAKINLKTGTIYFQK